MKKYKLLKKFQQLSLLSFVAACSGKSAEGSYFFGKGFDSKGEQKPPDQQPKTPLSFEAAALSEADSGYSVTEDGGATSLTVEVKNTQGTTLTATLTFSDGAQTVTFGANTGTTTTGIYKLTPTDNQYDLVVSVPAIDLGTVQDSNPEKWKGSIFIFWDVAGIKNETIGGTAATNNARLEIKGAYSGDFIGIQAPTFLQIAGKTDEQKYDMVIRSQWVSNTLNNNDIKAAAGAIYILWDVTGYAGATNVIDLGVPATIAHGSLRIFGEQANDYIGIHAPEFLEIDDNTKLDMVIRSHEVDFAGDGSATNNTNEGAIYILWDIASYYSTDDAKRNKTIYLGNHADDTLVATHGSLRIVGEQANDYIGTHAPDFLQIAGKTDEQKYDMVIRSQWVSNTLNNNDIKAAAGAIYILWDVTGYAGATNVIDLGVPATIAHGSLRIVGDQANDYIGTHAPEFLEIDDNIKLDMVIRSHEVDFAGDGSATNNTNEGAIYILWDVASYYSTDDAKRNKTIYLGNHANNTLVATHGLLGIFGEQANDFIGTHAPEFLEIDDNTKLDMVIRSQWVNNTLKNTDNSGIKADAGTIYILWNVKDYITAGAATAIDLGNLGETDNGATAGSLRIFGEQANNYIGTHAPEFLQIGGVAGDNKGGVAGDNKLDMVIRSQWVSNTLDNSDIKAAGAIYILWDVASYYSTDDAKRNKTIYLGDSANISSLSGDTSATHGLLGIFGAQTNDYIGTHAPEFLEIDDNTKLDMVIRSHEVDFAGVSGGINNTNKGAIYILWNVEDYFKAGTATPIDFGDFKTVTHGLLGIFGKESNDYIGTHAPEFLQIGGVAGVNKLDMVIRSHEVDFAGVSGATNNTNKGAIYVLWDVEDYFKAGAATPIDFGDLKTVTHGLLVIYGTQTNDSIGTHAPEFLQIGGVAGANKLDMVIRSHEVDFAGDGSARNNTNEGAIYVLWDVEDYFKAGIAKPIDLGATVYDVDFFAASGLLTIYGAATNAKLGSDANNVLYDTDTAGNKILTNIDGDGTGTKDIAFRDKGYTYILFGDKVAGTGGDDKVDSKTIDLANIGPLVDKDGVATANNEGFFSYDFDGVSGSAAAVDRVGYRFANRKADLDAVQAAYDALPSSLSDADAGVGVWDIA